jgi:hypothetical protein
MNTLIGLLIGFQIKHDLGDYVLQTTYMQKKADKGLGWIIPLTAHAGVHGALTLGILIVSGHSNLWHLAILDFIIHFVVDRIKGIVSRGLTPWGLAFRIAFGADQLAHFLTNLLIIHFMGVL